MRRNSSILMRNDEVMSSTDEVQGDLKYRDGFEI